MNDIADGIIGMAGQYVSAVLQTAGIYGQSQVLATFAPFLQLIGGLVYTVGLIGALISIALFGNYRNGIYFLIGPPLFYFVLTNSVNAKGTAYQYGTRRAPDAVERPLSTLRYSGNEKRYENGAQVSWFFATWDTVVSHVVQRIVALLVDTANNQDLIAVARERVFDQVLRARGDNKDYIQLLTVSYLGECAKTSRLMRELGEERLVRARPGTPEAIEKTRKAALLQDLLPRPVHLEQGVHSYVRTLGFTPENPSSCQKIYEYLRVGTLREAKRLLDPNNAALKQEFEPEVLAKAYAYVQCKLIGRTEQGNAVCDGTEGDTLSPQNAQKAADVLAAFYLKNSIALTQHAALTTQIAGREEWDKSAFRNLYGNITNHEISGIRLKIVHFAGSIPYIQGVLLYLLSLSFPFFAVFLLMPSRYSQFFVWMSLWVWVKSWDVGFAFVFFLREFFWKMSPHVGSRRTGANFTEIDWSKPETLFHVVGMNDPLVSPMYLVVALLTLSVPLVTAHFCLGATNLYNTLKMSIDGRSNLFGNDKAGSSRVGEYARINAALKNIENRAAYEAVLEASRDMGTTEDGVNRALSGSALMTRALNQAASEAFLGGAYSESYNDLVNYRGMVWSRQMDYRSGSGRGAVDAMSNRDREAHQDDSILGMTNIPGTTSEFPKATGPEAMGRGGREQPISGSDGDGGD